MNNRNCSNFLRNATVVQEAVKKIIRDSGIDKRILGNLRGRHEDRKKPFRRNGVFPRQSEARSW